MRFGPRATYVHGNHYTDDALGRIADSGSTISVSPVVEVELGFGAPVTGRALAAGVPTGLGADTVVSGPGDMFSLMRAAYSLERVRRTRGSPPATRCEPPRSTALASPAWPRPVAESAARILS